MSDHLVLYVDRLARPASEQPEQEAEVAGPLVGSSGLSATDARVVEDEGSSSEGEPLIKTAECRICQEEDSIVNLEMPCACSGSLKYAHRKCVQHWCNEKGDITCEICHQVSMHMDFFLLILMLF